MRTLDTPPFSPNCSFGNTPEEHLMEIFAAAQGDVERKQNRRQVIQKQKARLERGYWAFGAPKGYTQEKDAVHGKLLTPSEPDFSLIKESLEGYASGRFVTQQDACNFLTKSNYKGKGKKVYLTHFKEKLAQQVLYVGYVEYPKWEVSRRKGYHKPAISLATFEAVQEKLKDKGRPHYRTTTDEDFPLHGFLVCKSCDLKYTASWSKGRMGKAYSYYKCRNRECECYGKSIAREEAHGQFEEVLQQLIATDETISEIKEVFLEKWEERMKKKDTEKENELRELSKIDGDISHYLEMAKDATSDAIRKRYEKSADDLIKHQQVLEEKERENSRDKYEVGNALDMVLGFIKSPYNTWQNEDLIGKRMLLKLVFDDYLKYDKKQGVGTAQISEIVSVFNILEKPSEDGSHYVEIHKFNWKQFEIKLFEGYEMLRYREIA